MKKDTLIHLRVNQEIKEAFQYIVEQEGFTMSEVLEASMRDVVSREKIPLYLVSKLKIKSKPNLTIPLIKKCVEHVVTGKDKIKSISLFGSYSKGTATQSSNVDLFIDVDDGYTLFDLAELQETFFKHHIVR